MKRYWVTTSRARQFTVLARGIDDAAWTAARSLDNGESVIRVQLD